MAQWFGKEREFVALVNASKCEPEIKAALIFLLYTGIRRSELAGARIDGDFVSVWAGHAADNTQTSNVYTHFSPEFMKEQAQKVDYII